MADTLDERAVSFLKEIKAALLNVQSSLAAESLKIEKLELELKTTVSYTAGVGFKIYFIDIDATHKHEDERTITMTLVPSESDRADLMEGINEQLVDAIWAIASAAKEAAESAPPYDLDEASVSIALGMTNDGKVAVVVSGERESTNAHTATITLKRN